MILIVIVIFNSFAMIQIIFHNIATFNKKKMGVLIYFYIKLPLYKKSGNILKVFFVKKTSPKNLRLYHLANCSFLANNIGFEPTNLL